MLQPPNNKLFQSWAEFDAAMAWLVIGQSSDERMAKLCNEMEDDVSDIPTFESMVGLLGPEGWQ